jgi:hypothetical protein
VDERLGLGGPRSFDAVERRVAGEDVGVIPQLRGVVADERGDVVGPELEF